MLRIKQPSDLNFFTVETISPLRCQDPSFHGIFAGGSPSKQPRRAIVRWCYANGRVLAGCGDGDVASGTERGASGFGQFPGSDDSDAGRGETADGNSNAEGG